MHSTCSQTVIQVHTCMHRQWGLQTSLSVPFCSLYNPLQLTSRHPCLLCISQHSSERPAHSKAPPAFTCISQHVFMSYVHRRLSQCLYLPKRVQSILHSSRRVALAHWPLTVGVLYTPITLGRKPLNRSAWNQAWIYSYLSTWSTLSLHDTHGPWPVSTLMQG